jgi:hypothetical protein
MVSHVVYLCPATHDFVVILPFKVVLLDLTCAEMPSIFPHMRRCLFRFIDWCLRDTFLVIDPSDQLGVFGAGTQASRGLDNSSFFSSYLIVGHMNDFSIMMTLLVHFVAR